MSFVGILSTPTHQVSNQQDRLAQHDERIWYKDSPAISPPKDFGAVHLIIWFHSYYLTQFLGKTFIASFYHKLTKFATIFRQSMQILAITFFKEW